MPNHVINKVTISSDKLELSLCRKQIIDAYRYEDEANPRKFSFQTIIPMPESLNIESGSRTVWGMEYVKNGNVPNEWMKKWSQEEIDRTAELGRKALENIRKFGYKDWYDWRLAKWGTKWDAYEVEVSEEESSINLSFQTAWNTPFEAMEELSRQFPKLEIYVQYADEDLGCNCGTYLLKGGKVESQSYGDLDFARELWGYCEDEE